MRRRSEMARFRSTAAFVVAGRRYKAGQTYADAPGSVQAGDVLWVGLDSSKMSPALIPLDAGAVSMKAASVFSGIDYPRPDGANSVDA
jgi:hypothetical protein